jgi:hypothetical protein
MNHPDYPIVVGLAGQAGVGKTATADLIVPAVQTPTPLGSYQCVWDHLYFAMPLSAMVNTRYKTQGQQQTDRIRYQMHSILTDLFGNSPLYGAPPYEVLVEAVYDLMDIPLPEEGSKPRDFMQRAGDYCRNINKDCFTKWAERKVKSLHREFLAEENDEDRDPCLSNRFGVILSDIRFPNEAEMIINQPNGILIRLDGSKEVRHARLLQRDGAVQESLLQHKSETSLEGIPKEWFTAIIDTDDLSIEEQVQQVLLTVILQGAINA